MLRKKLKFGRTIDKEIAIIVLVLLNNIQQNTINKYYKSTYYLKQKRFQYS